jgi:hypothetical protein
LQAEHDGFIRNLSTLKVFTCKSVPEDVGDDIAKRIYRDRITKFDLLKLGSVVRAQ